jgi:parallel beta-helix repeat protein
LLRKAVSGITLILLIMNMLALAFNIQSAKSEPTTWTVDDDGTGDFRTIQEAINSANPGDTIFVKTGTYYENVVVNKSILLIGEDPTMTIVDGGGRLIRVVEIMANNVTITNFTIRNNNAVASWESNNCIYLANFNNTLIQNNIITSRGGYGGGIVVIDSSNNNISGNTIETTPNTGIRLYSTSNNVVFSNGITNSSGIELNYNSSNNVISNNTVKAYGSGDGIAVVQSFNNTVSGNTVKNMSWGIMLSWSSYNTVSKNIITNSSEYGFPTFGSSYNNISGNIITANKYDAIYLGQLSDHNRIYRNDLINNGFAGVTLASSSYNMISENNMTNNHYGIQFVKLMDTYSNSSKFYHNNFITNTKQVYAVFSDEYSTNIWDDAYPSGGNYWSDYNGADINGDGIGDTPYVIDENNQDSYPLMSPWSPTWSLKTPVEVPFWMQWWFWAIVAAGILVLAGAVYFLKKRKPSTPTAPTPPAERT